MRTGAAETPPASLSARTLGGAAARGPDSTSGHEPLSPRPVSSGSLSAAVLVIGAAFLLHGARDAWFFGDDWAFIVNRRQLWSDGRYAEYLLAPHNEHWTMVPVLVHGLLFRAFGLHSYLPYLVPVVACHLGICVALRAMMRRVGVGPWLATGGATLFLLLGSGAENLVWAFQFGFVLAVLLGLAPAAAGRPRRNVAGPRCGRGRRRVPRRDVPSGSAITMVAVVVVGRCSSGGAGSPPRSRAVCPVCSTRRGTSGTDAAASSRRPRT